MTAEELGSAAEPHPAARATIRRNRPPAPNETGVLPAFTLSANEQVVYDVLRKEDEISIDEVIRFSGLPSSAASVALLSLEMKRFIKQLPGKMFVRNQ